MKKVTQKYTYKNIQNKSIILLICYFGELPWYFRYFLHSCKYNLEIDFYLITDNDLDEYNMPVNVFPIKKSLGDIKSIASKKFGFEVGLDHTYKFCDFRPALAFLLPEYIRGYDFWGYGDIDVIYGDIRAFITNKMLSAFDVISVRHDFLPGAFSLFRNSQTINMLFKQSRDYVRVFKEPTHFCFDETNFTYDKFLENLPVDKIESEIESMTHVVKRLHFQKKINAYFDFLVLEGLPGKIKWDHGVLTYKNMFEAILYHLIKLKEIYTPKKIPKKIPDIFNISTTRIYF
ncbi:MAG: hypothetical protein QM768_15925 [Agriterribacter sp.]